MATRYELVESLLAKDTVTKSEVDALYTLTDKNDEAITLVQTSNILALVSNDRVTSVSGVNTTEGILDHSFRQLEVVSLVFSTPELREHIFSFIPMVIRHEFIDMSLICKAIGQTLKHSTVIAWTRYLPCIVWTPTVSKQNEKVDQLIENIKYWDLRLTW